MCVPSASSVMSKSILIGDGIVKVTLSPTGITAERPMFFTSARSSNEPAVVGRLPANAPSAPTSMYEMILSSG